MIHKSIELASPFQKIQARNEIQFKCVWNPQEIQISDLPHRPPLYNLFLRFVVEKAHTVHSHSLPTQHTASNARNPSDADLN